MHAQSDGYGAAVVTVDQDALSVEFIAVEVVREPTYGGVRARTVFHVVAGSSRITTGAVDRAIDSLLAARQEMLADPASATLEIQVRFSPAVDFKMAPHGGRDTCWFNINVLDPRASPEVVERLCQIALAHGARPHWAKIIPARMPRLAALYGDLPLQWEARRAAHDPDGLFLKDWYHRHFGFAACSRAEQDERAD